MAELIEEPASAKINLTLRVLGRRPDGYHEIESLVVFARFGDRLTLRPDEANSLSLSGPFAAAIVGTNLLETALQRLIQAAPELRLGAVTLEKNLPVAAGLGGGSADAAALLRAVQRLNPQMASVVAWHAIAQSLGADVPVCLRGTPALMWGIGERIVPLASIPDATLVLVNPRLPVAAGDVYRRLGADAIPQRMQGPAPPLLGSVHDLVSYASARRNDLEAPAIALCPQIADVKAVLEATPGALLVRMSGSGPTCFALFAGLDEASAAAAAVAQRQPNWWVVAAPIAA
jgi:4-diphosphocytidyl-2-C-methyl-D-erythritol kinase